MLVVVFAVEDATEEMLAVLGNLLAAISMPLGIAVVGVSADCCSGTKVSEIGMILLELLEEFDPLRICRAPDALPSDCVAYFTLFDADVNRDGFSRQS